MASNITLYLKENFLKTDAIIFETSDYDSTPREDFDSYEREKDDSGLVISVHQDTGTVLGITLEEFTTETEYAIKMLRDYPLPWTFSLPSMNIKEKPLEDVLLAVWKKHKNDKMEWE